MSSRVMREHSDGERALRQVVRVRGVMAAYTTNRWREPLPFRFRVSTDRQRRWRLLTTSGSLVRRGRPKRSGDLAALGDRPAARDQAVQHHNHGEYEQQVNQSATDMEGKRTQQPENE